MEGLGRQPVSEIDERDQVEGIVEQYSVHLAFEPSPDKICINAGDFVARDIGLPLPSTNVPLQGE